MYQKGVDELSRGATAYQVQVLYCLSFAFSFNREGQSLLGKLMLMQFQQKLQQVK
uniref:Uncharacterized protein n=1 Tax=Meloidogyne incognita TaxID=6306 RepID=A0A914MHL3_MELIC